MVQRRTLWPCEPAEPGKHTNTPGAAASVSKTQTRDMKLTCSHEQRGPGCTDKHIHISRGKQSRDPTRQVKGIQRLEAGERMRGG